MTRAAVILFALFLGAQTAEASAVRWLRCMDMCQEALDRKDPYAAWWRLQWDEYRKRWRDLNGRLREFPEEKLEELKRSSDEGRSFEQFKTCQNLCR